MASKFVGHSSQLVVTHLGRETSSCFATCHRKQKAPEGASCFLWTAPGSNRLPLPCHGSALPSELAALTDPNANYVTAKLALRLLSPQEHRRAPRILELQNLSLHGDVRYPP